MFIKSFAQEKTNSETLFVTEETIQRLLSADYNLGERMLYDHFNKTWWVKQEVRNPDFCMVRSKSIQVLDVRTQMLKTVNE